MILKPQDILFLLKLIAHGENPWTFNSLALDLGMSPSEVHAASNRSILASLAIKSDSGIRPNTRNLLEFLEHGIQYAFVPDRGPLQRGTPTAHAAPPLNNRFIHSAEPPPVWPDPEGHVRGEGFSPLYKSVPHAARQDPDLYALLVMVDAIRGGKAREKEFARKELRQTLKAYGQSSRSKH